LTFLLMEIKTTKSTGNTFRLTTLISTQRSTKSIFTKQVSLRQIRLAVAKAEDEAAEVEKMVEKVAAKAKVNAAVSHLLHSLLPGPTGPTRGTAHGLAAGMLTKPMMERIAALSSPFKGKPPLAFHHQSQVAVHPLPLMTPIPRLRRSLLALRANNLQLLAAAVQLLPRWLSRLTG
jgi:hypothetical protein